MLTFGWLNEEPKETYPGTHNHTLPALNDGGLDASYGECDAV